MCARHTLAAAPLVTLVISLWMLDVGDALTVTAVRVKWSLCDLRGVSTHGVCRVCLPYFKMLSGSSSISCCKCNAGYMKDQSSCAACREGTLWREKRSMSTLSSGWFLLGKQHHQTCLEDVVPQGDRGSCVNVSNFVCNSRYIDIKG